MESVEQVEFLIEAGPVLTRWKHDAFDRDRNRRRFAATELPIAEIDVVDDLVDCLERPVAKREVFEQQLEGQPAGEQTRCRTGRPGAFHEGGGPFSFG